MIIHYFTPFELKLVSTIMNPYYPFPCNFYYLAPVTSSSLASNYCLPHFYISYYSSSMNMPLYEIPSEIKADIPDEQKAEAMVTATAAKSIASLPNTKLVIETKVFQYKNTSLECAIVVYQNRLVRIFRVKSLLSGNSNRWIKSLNMGEDYVQLNYWGLTKQKEAVIFAAGLRRLLEKRQIQNKVRKLLADKIIPWMEQ